MLKFKDNNERRYFFIGLGATIVCFTDLWLGSYFLFDIPISSVWWGFPLTLTVVILGAISLMLAVGGWVWYFLHDK